MKRRRSSRGFTEFQGIDATTQLPFQARLVKWC
jgi:hypothetical protein